MDTTETFNEQLIAIDTLSRVTTINAFLNQLHKEHPGIKYHSGITVACGRQNLYVVVCIGTTSVEQEFDLFSVNFDAEQKEFCEYVEKLVR